jgi:hypothetical protein
MAERGGFEPPVPFGHTRFPSVLLKPLGHLSRAAEDMTIEAFASRATGGSEPATNGRPTAVGRAGFAGANPPLSAMGRQLLLERTNRLMPRQRR